MHNRRKLLLFKCKLSVTPDTVFQSAGLGGTRRQKATRDNQGTQGQDEEIKKLNYTVTEQPIRCRDALKGPSEEPRGAFFIGFKGAEVTCQIK